VLCTSPSPHPNPPSHHHHHPPRPPAPLSRERLEGRISRGVHALEAAWRRLQLLQEAVLGQGAVLTDPQLAKEREQIVAIRDRLKQAQVRHVCHTFWVGPGGG
jgi:hypothetical protein